MFGIPHNLPLPASVPEGSLVWFPGAHASPPSSLALWPSGSAHSTPAVVLSSTSFSGQTVKGSAAWLPMRYTKTPDAPPAPAQGHRTKYVVIAVRQAATYHDRRGTPVSTDWHITLRRADQGAPPRYAYYVNAPADRPAPAAVNGILELDPRLVDVEPA